MIRKENIRSYEVSIWTLQDSFITVLKASNLEKKGDIEEPQMVLKDDGENTVSFKIPMYLPDGKGSFKENPIWYNVINGTLISDLRKIKVIFNKKAQDEEVFEFLITNVEESHEGYEKYCSVSCEGLAFNELGKQGYKIALEGADEINIVQKKWFEGNQTTIMPVPNINYWADKVFANTNWRYSVQMDWSAYDGVINDTYDNLSGEDYSNLTQDQKNIFNNERENAGLRRRDTIYEDEYTSQWQKSATADILISTEIEGAREKYRMIEASESNRYNLSQTIAEAFQVFCKYKYYYDDNYHIIDREAIFYNNFLNESSGIIDLTYKYDTQKLTRTMEGTDTITKMFVRPLTDNDMPTGEVTIMDALANKGLEDYLLNFDYLYGIGAISQEQYDAVSIYQAQLHNINKDLGPLQEEKIVLEEEKTKLEAKIKTLQDSIDLSEESLGNINSSASAIQTNENGNIAITATNPKPLVAVKELNSDKYYVKLSIQGIIRESIKLYASFSNGSLSRPITQFNVETDDAGNINKIVNIKDNNLSGSSNMIWATFEYSMPDYYKKVSQYYNDKMNKDAKARTDSNNRLTAIQERLNTIESETNNLINQKENIINQFERFMGPSLREGTWQPEDEYSGYGTVYNEFCPAQFSTTDSSFNNNQVISFGWDDELFDEEQELFYYFGIQGDKHYYPCIELTDTILTKFNTYEDLSKLNFIYKLNKDTNNQSDKEYMALGSKMVISFVKVKISNTTTIKPVLLLIGAENLSDTQLTAMVDTGYLATINIDSTTEEYSETKIIDLSEGDWIISPTNMTANTNYKIVYPRIQINSNKVKSPKTNIYLKRDSIVLENYSDFYIFNRDSKWYVTLKPEAIFKTPKNISVNYQINFVVSTAALAIYLDAVQIMKENAYPKVSYEIELSSVNKNIMRNAYQRLGQIAHINDAEFKFENTLGYISEVDLDLDHPWQDKVVIKNYKTKFEDLFSTIVAQTEQMKKNSYIIGAVSDAFSNKGTLSDNLVNDIYNRFPTQLERVISPAEEYLKYEPFIRQELKQSWDEAGKVLAAATSSVEAVNGVILEGADILAGFKENIKENLTPTIFDGSPRSKDFFKIGDIWKIGTNEYLATKNSSQIQYVSGENKLTSLKGWSLIQDGTLAAIKGASLNIDSKAGKIDLLAENELNVATNGKLKLAGNNVQIIGNKDVQIGGPDVYIYSASKKDTNDTTPNHGIHIYASQLGMGSSTVDVTGQGIEMRAANGITFESGGGLNFSTSDGANTSAISIDKDTGIYLGSNAPLIFYSGDITESIVNNKKTFTGSGAAAKLTKDRILFGVSDGSTGTAVDLTKDYIVFGVGDVVNGNNVSNIGDKGTSGVQITKDFIKLATGDSSINSYIGMDKNGIIISNQTSSYSGGLVKINQKGVIIGTASSNNVNGIDTTTDKNNIKNDKTPRTITSSMATFQVYAPNFVVDADGHLYAYDADIAGKIRATSGQIGGWIIGSEDLYYNASSRLTAATGLYPGAGPGGPVFWAGGIRVPSQITEGKASFTEQPSNYTVGDQYNGKYAIKSNTTYNEDDWLPLAPFRVTKEGKLYATGANISGTITATAGTIGNFKILPDKLIYVPSEETLQTKAIFGIVPYITATSPYTQSDVDTWPVLWIGGGRWSAATVNNNDYPTNVAPFRVLQNGKLLATNVDISGVIKASSLTIDGKSSEEYVNDTIDNSISSGAIKTLVDSVKTDLQSQIDGEIDTWFFVGTPAPQTNGTARLSDTLEKEWGITWTANTGYNDASKLIILRHNSDVYYDIGVTTKESTDYSATAGRAYRFIAKETTSGNISTLKYYWSEISDTATTDALKQAAQAQATADGKITTYYGTGTPTKTDAADGDLYINSTDNEVFRFNATTKNWVSIRDTAFYLKTFFNVDKNSGIIRGGAHKTDPITGKVFEGANIVLDNSGYIELSSMKDSKDIAKLTLDANGNIILSSGNKTVGNSNLKLTPTSISITSGGVFNVDSTNFYVKSNATSGNINFRLGPSSSPDLSYTIGTGLSVKGAITATSGTIGGINIRTTSDQSTHYGTEVLYVESTNESRSIFYQAGLQKIPESTYPFFYVAKKIDNSKNWIRNASDSSQNNIDWMFYVTGEGKLYARDAEIYGAIHASSGTFTGTINASSGTIGGWIINPILSTKYSTSKVQALVYCQSGTNQYLEEAVAGIYPGTPDDTASVLWVGGTRFTNQVNGISQAPFRVTKNGKLYSTDADITGNITATSLTVGNANTMTYSSSNGLKIGTGDNYLEYKNSTLTIKGGIIATSGTIGGWTIGSNYIGNQNTINSSTVGLSKDGTYSFWAGGTYNGTGTNTPTFSVTPAGTLISKAGMIGNWIITESSLQTNSYSSNIINGISMLTGGGIRLQSTSTGGSIIIDKNNGSNATSQSIFIMDSSASNGYYFYVGDSSQDNYMMFTNNNKLMLQGEIQADRGAIARWKIQPNFIGYPHPDYSGSTLRGEMIVGMSCVDEQSNVDDETVAGHFCAFWAGGNKNLNDPTGLTLSAKDTAFFVKKNGYVHITKGEILVKHLMSQSVGNNKYRFYISSTAPTTDSFSIANGRFELDRILWIQPSGSSLTTDHVKSTECKVYWCEKVTT